MNVTGDTITFSNCRNDALGSGFGESSRTVVGSRETLVPCKDKKAVAAHFLSKDLLFFFSSLLHTLWLCHCCHDVGTVFCSVLYVYWMAIGSYIF